MTREATISADEAMELLKRAVAEKGTSYIDPGARLRCCRYFNQDGSPSCIVGHVLHYAGLSIEDIGDNNDSSVPDLSRLLDDDAVEVLEQAQEVQDASEPWVEALEAAQNVYDDLVRYGG